MTHSFEEIHRLQRSGLIWLIAYLSMMALVVWLVFHARDRVMESLSSPEARAEWEDWRNAASEQSISGPVKRRKPESPEPPALVLMRDSFGVVLAAAIVLGSVLFATFMFMARGTFHSVANRRSGPPSGQS